MHRLRNVAFLLLAASLSAACEDSPIAPVDEADDFALTVVGPTPLGVRPAPLTLPGLLHTAIHRVYTTEGPARARMLVADLTALQSVARASSDHPDSVAAVQRRAHAEQLKIVLRVFGDEASARVITELRAEEAALHRALSDASPDAARDMLAQAGDLLARAEKAEATAPALDDATRAAALLAAARIALSEHGRIPGLDEIFRTAAARILENGNDDQLAAYRRAQVAADQAARAPDGTRAQAALDAVRDEQIRIVLSVYGPEAGQHLLMRAREAAAEVRVTLRSARDRGHDLVRLERMHATARDMLMRADAAYARGDARTAIDLGSHAVSLLNALRLALAGY